MEAAAHNSSIFMSIKLGDNRGKRHRISSDTSAAIAIAAWLVEFAQMFLFHANKCLLFRSRYQSWRSLPSEYLLPQGTRGAVARIFTFFSSELNQDKLDSK